MSDEPALITAAISALIALAVGFGLPWTPEQVALSIAFVIAMQGVITRHFVTPTAKIQDN